ncbi:unnamed protein product [Cylicostephanus goldi]|uniref:CUB domain-containing protein n=1 Tax=Cylicostephanus goldi TaxID=71465 RepID=A0A3P7LZU8_CYLGO|nr:unnamed protein product [Cylicostephanus goldi]
MHITGEPSDWGDCVALSSSLEINGWVTVDCEYSQFYLCEMAANGPAAIIMHDEEGQFESPEYPNNYPNDVAVSYFIELPADNRIVVTIEYMFTEELRDILHIYDGPWEMSPTLARLSGFHQNHSFLSHSNVVMAEFSSDGESNGNEIGFKAHYRAWSPRPAELLQQREGILSSTNFPLLAPPFTYQHFLIQCADVDHVHVNITGQRNKLELCGDDHLVLFEGTTISHRVLRK